MSSQGLPVYDSEGNVIGYTGWYEVEKEEKVPSSLHREDSGYWGPFDQAVDKVHVLSERIENGHVVPSNEVYSTLDMVDTIADEYQNRGGHEVAQELRDTANNLDDLFNGY
jgi:hypothetical protein